MPTIQERIAAAMSNKQPISPTGQGSVRDRIAAAMAQRPTPQPPVLNANTFRQADAQNAAENTYGADPLLASQMRQMDANVGLANFITNKQDTPPSGNIGKDFRAADAENTAFNQLRYPATPASYGSDPYIASLLKQTDTQVALGQKAAQTLTGTAKNTAGQYINTVGVVGRALDSTGTDDRVKAETIARLEEQLRNPSIKPMTKAFLMQQIENVRNWRTVSDVDTKAKELLQGGAKDIESAKYGLGKVGKTLVDVGSGAASLAGDIAIAAATGGSAMLPMALRSFGGAAYQAEQKGATVGQQLLYGTASAVTSFFVEKLSNVGGALSKAYGNGILDKALAAAAAKLPVRMLAAGLGEGFEESLEATLDPIWQRLIYDKTASLDAQEILYQGLVGAIIGSLAGSARNVDTRNPQTAARQLNEIAEALPAEIRPAPLEAQTATVKQVEAKKDEVAAALEEYQKAVKAKEENIAKLEDSAEKERSVYRNLYAEFRSTDAETRRPDLITDAQAQMTKVNSAESAVQKAQEELEQFKQAHDAEIEAQTAAEIQTANEAETIDIVSDYDGRFISEDALTDIEKIGVFPEEVSAIRAAHDKAVRLQRRVVRLTKQLSEAETLKESTDIQSKLDKATAQLEIAAQALLDAQSKITAKAQSAVPSVTPQEAPQAPIAPAPVTTPVTPQTVQNAPKTGVNEGQTQEVALPEGVGASSAGSALPEVVMNPPKVKGKSIISEAYTRLIDSQHPISKFAKVAGDKVRELASNSRSAGGIVNHIIGSKMVNANGDIIGAGLDELVKQYPALQTQEFWQYMAERHNIDRAREGKNVIPQHDSAASQKAVQNIEAANPDFKVAGDAITNWIDTFMQTWGVSSGLIDPAVYAKLRQTYPSYFPTQRVFDDLEIGLPDAVKNQFIDQRSPVLTATGSSRDIRNPLQNIIELVNRTVKAAAYNKVGQQMLIDLRRDPLNLVKFARENANADPKLDNVHTVLVNGKQVYIEFNDAQLNQAMRGLPKTTLSIPVMSKLTGAFKSLITQSNPFFGVRNIVRDVPTSYVYGSESNPIKFAADLLKAAGSIIKGGDSYSRYQAVGGGTANFFNVSDSLKTAQQLGQKPSIPKQIVQAFQDFNSITETAPRLAEFERVYQQTGDVSKALDAANNVTVNFARGGDITKAVDRNFAPYLNAGLQGLDKLVRSFSTPRSAFLTLARGGVMVFAPTVLMAILNRDDEDYDALTNQIKDNYYCIPYGDGHKDGVIGNGKFIRLPKSRELGFLLSTLPERIYRAAQGEDGAFKGVGRSALTAYLPNNPMTSNILSPVTSNLAKNETFSGAAIEPQGMRQDGRSPELMYDDTTSELGKFIGQMIKFLPDDAQLSPKQIDYLIDAYTGIIGDVILPATTRGQGAFSVIGRQFTADPLYSNQTVVDFYENLEKAQQIATDKNLLRNIPAKDMTLEEKRKSAMSKASEEMSALTKLAIKANIGTLSADEKKALKDDYGIDANAENLQEILRAKRIAIAEKANQLYETGTEMDFDLARSEPISDAVKQYQAAGISEKQAYTLYNALKALQPEAGKDQPSKFQKVQAVTKQPLTAQQKTALITALYTEHDNDGNVTRESLLDAMPIASKLIQRYLDTQDSAFVNMGVPSTVTDDKVEYTLTPQEKTLYRKTFTEYVRLHITATATDKTILKKLKEAAERAKKAVLRGR
jgi:hypothetical protein